MEKVESEVIAIRVPAEFKAAFAEACRRAEITPAKQARAMMADFIRQHVEIDFDEASMAEGWPAGRPRPDRRKRAQTAS